MHATACYSRLAYPELRQLGKHGNSGTACHLGSSQICERSMLFSTGLGHLNQAARSSLKCKESTLQVLKSERRLNTKVLKDLQAVSRRLPIERL
jgi:hypothetical protein